MSTRKVTPAEVESILRNTLGGFFTVTFVKRGDNEVRVMRATLNYKNALKGGKAAYNHAAKKLLVVRDMDATRNDDPRGPIRSIPWDAVISIVADHITYEVEV